MKAEEERLITKIMALQKRFPPDMVTMTMASHFRDLYKERALEMSIYYGFSAVSLQLLRDGADPNGGLVQAVANDSPDMIRVLIKFGANDFDAALIEAIHQQNHNLIKFFTEKGVTNLNEATILAIEQGQNRVAKYLVENGADDLDNILFFAAGQGSLGLVKFLVDKGAKDLRNAFQNAAIGGHSEVAVYLRNLL